MKKAILILFLLGGGFSGYTQCDKPVVLTSSKTEYLDSTLKVQRTEDEKSTIEIGKSEVIIAPGNEERKMTGTIKSTTCNWTVPYKEGKTIIKSTLSGDGGETMNLTLTIEGKGGKVTLLAEVQEMPDRKIRVAIDKFEEKK